MGKDFKISEDYNGEKITLALNIRQLKSAIGACEANSSKEVLILKKNGEPLFFFEEKNAINCMYRHNFQGCFKVELETMVNFYEKNKPKQTQPKKTEPKQTEIKTEGEASQK